MKACNSHVVKKREKTLELARLVLEYIHSTGVDIVRHEYIDWVAKMVLVLKAVREEDLYWQQMPIRTVITAGMYVLSPAS